MIIRLINVIIFAVIYQVYKRIPRTQGLDVNYFNNDLEDYDNIPTY